MLTVCSQYAGSMLAVCWQYAGSMLAVCWQYARSMLTVCWQYAHSMLAVCWQYAHSMLAVCSQYAGSMLAVCSQYARSMLTVCSQCLSLSLGVTDAVTSEHYRRPSCLYSLNEKPFLKPPVAVREWRVVGLLDGTPCSLVGKHWTLVRLHAGLFVLSAD
jgi:hypothetical protein